MNGIVLSIYLICLAIYVLDFWYLGKITEELKVINRYLKDLADKEKKT